MYRLLRHLLTCCCLGFAVVASAQSVPVQVVIVSSAISPAYEEASKALVDALEQAGVRRGAVARLSAEDMVRRATTPQLGTTPLFVGLGVRATQSLLSAGVTAPVLSALIPRRSFEQLLQSSGRNTSGLLSAIYLDQPLRRQLALVRLALPQARQVGVLLGPDSVAKLPELHTNAQGAALLVRHVEVAGDQALFPALREVLDGSDVFLALADPLVFNSTSIQNILLSSFKARVPMVAFSPAYVRAGATLALYSSPAQVGRQVALVALAALRSGRLPEQPAEPDDFLVDVNLSVTRALGLTLDGAELRQALRRLEHLP